MIIKSTGKHSMASDIKRQQMLKMVFLYCAIVMISTAGFIYTYGTRILNPQFDDWLLSGGDLSQHYIGWEAYRVSPWTFPIGSFSSLTYPAGLSILFTDSIPLFAVFFKILSPILPETFQYWGFFGLFSYIMLGVISVTLIKKYSSNIIFILTGSSFFVFSPYVLHRLYGHEALGGGQWLILLAFASLVYYEECFQNRRNATIFWGALAFLSVAVHLYFSMMCLMVLCGFVLYDFIKQRNFSRVVQYMASFGGGLVFNIAILGGFGGGSKVSGGLGVYSANLNSLVNSQGMSKILPALPLYGSGQYEGFAYLGFGIILLCPIAIAFLIFNIPKEKINKTKLLSFLAVALIAAIYAASHMVSFGDWLLYTIPLPRKLISLLSIFRASGRFMWVVGYLIYLGAIAAISSIKLKRGKELLACFILCSCFILQFYDLSGIIGHKDMGGSSYTNSFSEEETVQKLFEEQDIKHICVVTPQAEDVYYLIAQYAMLNGATVNRFNTVHGIGKELEDSAIKSLENPPVDTVYIVEEANIAIYADFPVNVYKLNNGFVIAYTGTISGVTPEVLSLNG